MKVFDFTDYKKFVAEELKSRPKAGHGQFQKIAKAINVHSTMVTHIFRGSLHLSPEQSLAMAEFLGLSELETDYFNALVSLARAGDQRTKRFYEKRVSEIKEKATNIRARLSHKDELDEEDQATFYSSWAYAAARLLTAIPEFQNRSALAQELNLPATRFNQVMDFLVSRGLCEEKGNKLIYANMDTYVSSSNPLVTRHHSNWRLKVNSQLEKLTAQELAYTSPIVISESDFAKIREEIVRFIEHVDKIAIPSPSEKLCCLNIDWVQIKN